MRIVLIHHNYHSGGAEIAGNWPPAWVAYLAGHLRAAGFDDIHFIDAMTNHMPDDALRARLAELKPDIVGTTAANPLRLPGAVWHAAVFTALFSRLVHPRARARADCATDPACDLCTRPACGFALSRGGAGTQTGGRVSPTAR